jgi:hypothetical protein
VASELRLGLVQRKLRRLGCTLRQTGKSHWHVERAWQGEVLVGGFAARSGRWVLPHYAKHLQRRLHISAREWENA